MDKNKHYRIRQLTETEITMGYLNGIFKELEHIKVNPYELRFEYLRDAVIGRNCARMRLVNPIPEVGMYFIIVEKDFLIPMTAQQDGERL